GGWGLVVTVDVPLHGTRDGGPPHGMAIPPRIAPRNAVPALRRLGWTRAIMRPPAIGVRNLEDEIQGDNAVSHQEFVKKHVANLSLTWDSIAKVRMQWDCPI